MFTTRFHNNPLPTTFDGAFGVHHKHLIGSLIGAGLGVASSIIGGIASSRANARAEAEMLAQNARNEAWYQRRYNEDYADTAAGQNLIRQAKDYARENWKKAQGAAAVGGGTDAATAMAKEAGNKVIGNTLGNMAAQDTARKTNVDNIHNQQQQTHTAQQVALAQQRANSISQVAGSASSALMAAGTAFDGANAKSTDPNAKPAAPNTGKVDTTSTTVAESISPYGDDQKLRDLGAL